MPRGVLNLLNPVDLQSIKGVWRFAPGLVPGEPNEGLVSQLEGSPARLVDYDDSNWEVREDLTKWVSRGVTFAWYRLKVTLPERVEGRELAGSRCIFETCIDDYGELWIEANSSQKHQADQPQDLDPAAWFDGGPFQGKEFEKQTHIVGDVGTRRAAFLCEAGEKFGTAVNQRAIEKPTYDIG